jgi:hypothetical protein
VARDIESVLFVMAYNTKEAWRPTHLRLVGRTEPRDLPPVLTDRAARRQFEELTQALVDAAIEIIDLVEGDADFELNGDEYEDGDGI